MSGLDVRSLMENEASSKKKIEWDIQKILNTEISFSTATFSDKNKESFYLELSTLLVAGLDIKSALELLEEDQAKPKHGLLIRSLKDDLVRGLSLWEAMRNSKQFTPYEYFTVQVGEETGKLTIVLDQLYQYFSERIKQRQQLIGALSYPMIILFTSVGAVTFMLLFIVPMFSDVFRRFGADLPGLTKFMISLSTAIKENFLFALALLVVLIFLIYTNRKKAWFEKYTSLLLKKVPVIGNIVYGLHLARFCTSLSLLLGSKVPLVRSIELVEQMISFYPIRITMGPVAKNIMNGRTLYSSLSEFPVYNKKMISLLKVGEEVNKLDVFFEKLAVQFSSSAKHQTTLLNTFLEPLMIIFLGFVVGFILLAMYLPMFQISSAIGG